MDSEEPDYDYPETCLARNPKDPLGLQEGDFVDFSACHRHFTSSFNS